MKVGIVTMISDNYGNRLQNYALQQILKKIGNDVETLNNPWEISYNRYYNFFMAAVKTLIYRVTGKPVRYLRTIRFKNFNKKYIKFSRYWLNKDKDINKAAEFYDMFVCGSDQVWNSEAKEIDGKYFASFASFDKRGSYAASFGINEVIPERTEEFSRYISGMKYISVREQSGLNIVQSLTNRKAFCHLDPTFLLTAQEWDQIASEEQSKEKYIFCYFLGMPSKELIQKINNYAGFHNLSVRILCEFINSPYNTCGPAQFISLIKNAEFILTDSFHGTVFSIIYEKPFYSFTRNGVKREMVSRIKSILDLLHMENRFEPCDLIEKDIYNINYYICNSIIADERKKSLTYLKKITTCRN